MGETDWEKLGLVLMGGAMLSKSLIQFSIDGQGSVPSLFDLRSNSGGGNEDNGNFLQKGSCIHCHTQNHCRWWLQPWLLLGRKAMTNLDSLSESRDVTLLTKVHLVKAMVFTIVMYGCESWNIRKAERQRIDDFELWCWRRLESPLDHKEIKPVNHKGN